MLFEFILGIMSVILWLILGWLLLKSIKFFFPSVYWAWDGLEKSTIIIFGGFVFFGMIVKWGVLLFSVLCDWFVDIVEIILLKCKEKNKEYGNT